MLKSDGHSGVGKDEIPKNNDNSTVKLIALAILTFIFWVASLFALSALCLPLHSLAARSLFAAFWPSTLLCSAGHHAYHQEIRPVFAWEAG